MKHIYYKNDFAVEITLLNASGEVIAPPEWEWHIEFTDGRRKYICSVDNGNAKVVGNTIMCYLDNHKFCCGEIGYKFVQAIPDLNYLDGFQNLITPKALPIELWEQESDNDVNIQSSLVPAYVVYDAYMTAKANGYTGTAEEFYDALIHIVDIKTAEAERVEAEANRVTAEQQRVENFVAMESALTTATNKANTATIAAEQSAERANTAADNADVATSNATQATTQATAATKRANDISADLEAKREADYWRGSKGDKGDKGDTGAKGDRGEKGDQGERGLQGVQGVKGDDGVSPTVTTSKTGKVTTIEITDAQGTHTATVNDGDSVEVVQSTGTSTTSVMSQKAVTEISDKVDELNSSLVYHDNLIVDNTTPFMQGYLDVDGTFVETSGSNTQKTTDFIAVDNAIVYKLDFLGHLSGTQYTSVRAICFYDSEKHYISRAPIPSAQDSLVIPKSASYIRINVNVDVVDDFSMYPLSEGKQQYLEILDNVKFNRLEELKEKVNGIGDLPSKVNTTIDLYDPYIASLANTTFLQGYLDSNGEFIATTNTQKTTDFIELANGNVYELAAVGHTGTQTGLTIRAVFLYDSDKVMTRILSIPSELTFGINYNEKYIRVNINVDVIDDFYIRVKGGYVTGVIKDDVKYERLQNVESKIKSIWHGGYIHSRRATIAFIIDGCYQYNQNRIDIFEKHGIKVGIAPQYTMFKDKFQVSSFDEIKTFIGWQKDGHEILAHLNYILNETTSIDDETAKGYIREAQRVMSARGFVVNGCIGSSGEVAERLLPTIKQCFAYSATKNNHQGESIPIHEYDTADAYKLWRYSLQNSTPEQQKNAVDMAIENNALLLFYGHADSVDDYFSDENLDSLLEYIDTKRNDFLCQVKTPFDAITDFFSIRKEDLL